MPYEITQCYLPPGGVVDFLLLLIEQVLRMRRYKRK